MKKISLICAISLLFASFCIFPTCAATENNLKLSVVCTDSGISVGADTDFIPAGISGSFVITPKDNGDVTFSQSTIGENLSAYNTAEKSFGLPSNGTVKFALMGDIMNGGSEGNWFTANLSNKSNDGSVSICLNGFSATNANGDSLTVTKTPDIDIQLKWIDGDANGDMALDIKDLVRAKKLAVGQDDSTVKYLCNADINDSGDIDAEDLVGVKKILLGV